MEKKAVLITVVLAFCVGFVAGGLGGGIAALAVNRLAGFRDSTGWHLQVPAARLAQRPAGGTSVWNPGNVAAPDSIEEKLRSQGKHWVPTGEEITVGSYVLDHYEGRLNQPIGRGAIGKVIAVSEDNGQPRAATVDFGRGFVVGVLFSELTPVQITP
jgi:hypothetical protein